MSICVCSKLKNDRGQSLYFIRLLMISTTNIIRKNVNSLGTERVARLRVHVCSGVSFLIRNSLYTSVFANACVYIVIGLLPSDNQDGVSSVDKNHEKESKRPSEDTCSFKLRIIMNTSFRRKSNHFNTYLT